MKPLRLLLLLTTVLTFGLIVSCDNSTNTNEERWYPPEKPTTEKNSAIKKQKLWGHWVCADFIDLVKARKTVRGVRNRPMFLEVVFKPEFGDSALLVTGYNNLFVPYKRVGEDTIVIKNVRAGKNLILRASAGLQSLELPDSLTKDDKEQLHLWVFTKTSGIKKNKSLDINHHINKGVLSGSYSNASQKVSFKENGKIQGWKNFSDYEICKGGDCFMLTRSPLDIITLSTGSKQESFAFWIKNNDSLYFYLLEKISEDNYYNYQPKEVAYAFKKSK